VLEGVPSGLDKNEKTEPPLTTYLGVSPAAI
jgi:hypothetical protein